MSCTVRVVVRAYLKSGYHKDVIVGNEIAVLPANPQDGKHYGYSVPCLHLKDLPSDVEYLYVTVQDMPPKSDIIKK